MIQAYGIVHDGGGPRGSDIALPASFLIDTTGRIAWEHVSRKVQERPDPADVMKQVERLLSAPPATTTRPTTPPSNASSPPAL